ncbi:MAG: ABC transporter ATP-binding protein [Treponema sp.]|jgi:iron complex transport system ATP-binding protein|nr:ABC transporter ATP-binding protein [Treponema sp.]
MVSLEARNVSFAYGKRAVLQDVSFTLSSGKLFALLGANGAGKSTLFRCILGLEPPQTGEVSLNGENIRKKSPAQLARHIAYIPQIHYPAFNYSALDMVLMGTAAQGREWSPPGAAQRQAAEEAMERIGFAHLRFRGFRELSGGEQQLVLIARALAQKASLLVMDEPAASLDYGNQFRVLRHIKALNRQGYGIILSTHNPDHAFLFADHALALHDTRIIASGAPAEVLTEQLITTLYGIPVAIRREEQGITTCVPIIDW